MWKWPGLDAKHIPVIVFEWILLGFGSLTLKRTDA